MEKIGMNKFPEIIANEEQLEELLSRPTPEAVEYFKKLDGDIIFLGIAGKIDPSLAEMASRVCQIAGVEIPKEIFKAFQKGLVIPALPLDRQLDERCQRALMRYYLDAGAGGVAVAVHTTQFEIRQPAVGLYGKILEIAKEEFDRFSENTQKPVIRIAGVIGETEQAVNEAKLALKHGYHAVLLGLAAFDGAVNEEIIKHCKIISEIIPVVGFYLQPAVGGYKLDVDFWRDFAGIENVIGIKMAPFNRYQTFDLVRAVAESGRSEKIALYTGNDDNILVDLLSEYSIKVDGRVIKKRIVGGLLGHWAVWTKKVVELLVSCHV